MNTFEIVSPDFAIQLKIAGFRPPTSLNHAEFWYCRKGGYYQIVVLESEAKIKIDSGKIKHLYVTSNSSIDLSKLYYAPTVVELQEYLSGWNCKEKDGEFICNYPKVDSPSYSANRRADSLAKAWVGEQYQLRAITVEKAIQLKQMNFLPPQNLVEGDMWYTQNKVLIKLGPNVETERIVTSWDGSKSEWHPTTEIFYSDQGYFAPKAFQFFQKLIELGEKTDAPITENNIVENLNEWAERWINAVRAGEN